MGKELLVRLLDALRQRSCCSPSECGETMYVEKFAGRAVRLRGVPPDLALITDDVCDELRQLSNREFLMGVDQRVLGGDLGS
jgi:hypothetical protein